MKSFFNDFQQFMIITAITRLKTNKKKKSCKFELSPLVYSSWWSETLCPCFLVKFDFLS